MSGPFTQRQRAVLKNRLAKAIRWHHSQTFEKENAERLAETLIVDMESSYLDSAAQRRAIVNLSEKLERTA